MNTQPHIVYPSYLKVSLQLLLLLLLSPLQLAAFDCCDDNEPLADSVWVNNIVIEGNKRTKDWVILRELSFKQGQKISSHRLDSLLKIESDRVFNTDLFILSKIEYKQNSTQQIEIKIKVKERWYLYALPFVDVADRNFNEWLKDRDRDLSRLMYGVKVKQKNFRGRNESLKAGFKWGFNREISVGYEIPYIDKKRTLGINTSVKYITNNGVAYQTEGNKLAFFSNDQINRRRFDVNTSLNKRTGFYTFHSITAKYRQHWASDTIIRLNPNYFLASKNSAKAFELSYYFKYDFRDIRAYPLKGELVELSLTKLGLGIFKDVNIWEANAHFTKFTEISKKLFLANTFRTKISSGKQQPYGFVRGLGFRQSFVRGYDLYVIDAQHYILNRNTLRMKLLEKVLNISKVMPLEQFNTIPLKIFSKVFFDTAYSKNRFLGSEFNTLDNKWLYGGGVGVDIVSFYNAVTRIEYSVNGLGETGFFFYYNASF